MSYSCAVDIRRDIARAARPPERIRVSEAAQRHVRLRTASGGTEAWSPAVTPYMVEPMDRLTSRRYQAVVFVGPARTGKTGGLLGFVGYVMKCDPSDMLIVHMTQQKAAKFSKKELRRLFRDSASLRREISPRAQDDNTFDKFFRSGSALYIGYPAASQLSADTLKYVALTDYDRMPESVDGEGSPFQLARKRTQTYLSRGMTYVETSPGFDVIDAKWTSQSPHEAPPTKGALALYNLGTRCRLYLPCPHCGAYFMEPMTAQGFDFAHQRDLLGATIADNYGPVRLACAAGCGALITEDHKDAMLKASLWAPDGCAIEHGRVVGEVRDAPYATYWLSGAAARYQSWEEIVRNYLMAERIYDTTGDEEHLRNTTTQDMGGPFLSRALQAERDGGELMARRESYPRALVVSGVRFLLANVDIQGGKDKRFVVQVIGYGVAMESWLIDRFSIRYLDQEEEIRINPASNIEHWDALLEQVMARTYPLDDDSGREMPVHLTICDSGGEDGVTDRAYDFYRALRRRGQARRFMLVKGSGSRTAARVQETYPDNRARKDRKAGARGDVPVWQINTNLLKDAVSNNMGREEPGPGYMHWPDWLKQWFFDELTAENRQDDGAWDKIGSRNETFDLYVYGYAGLLRLGADRMDWQRPRPWALPWDENPEVVAGDGSDHDPAPLPVRQAGRHTRFRMR